jgi:hypothetical protein
MKKKLSNILLFAFLVATLSACIGQHNQAEVESLNQDSKRIYGNKGGEPMQLNNTYPEDETGETADRIQKIREDFFPE